MKSFVRIVGVVAAVVMAAAACTQPSTGGGSGGGGGAWTVDPSAADPATNSDPGLAANRVYAPVTAPRNALAVVLHGTNSVPSAHDSVAVALRNDGYHVILMRYSATLGTLYACPDTDAVTNPDCHRKFRHETTFGAGVTDPDGTARDHATANISSANSVVNRLLKLVEHMAVNYPTSGYEQFQDKTGSTCNNTNANYGACELDWSRVAVLGHSQGAGVALFMAKHYSLRASGLFSGTYDAFVDGGVATAAPWTSEGGFDTAPGSIRTLMHTNDYGQDRIRAVAAAVGIPGPEVSATVTPFTTNQLLTSLTPQCPFDSVPGHNSTSVDGCVPGGAYYDAWRFMAGS
ncbi:MAG: hypothetical protein ACR2OH_14140 [Microthrixaceae bacterium]